MKARAYRGHWLIGAVFVLLSVVTYAPADPATARELGQRLVGQCVGKSGGKEVVAIFSVDGKATMIQPREGIVAGRYTADFSVQPATLTINAGAYVGETIVEFVSPEKLRIEQFHDDAARPTHFSRFYVLTKK